MKRCLSCMKEYDNEIIIKGRESSTCPFCGYNNDTQPKEIYHLRPGTTLKDRYIIGVVIGFGGFGIIYKAWDKSLDIVVAIKEYYPTGLVQRIVGENNVSIFEKSKKKDFYSGMTRFMSEAKNMSHFSYVPNIVHVNQYFEENNTAYIVMEYLEGITLNEMLEKKGKLTDEETNKIMFPIMDALQELHSDNILHRDVSPDNIFICKDGNVKLIDFGAARFSDIDNEITRSIVLKAGYAPVEQYRAKSKQGPFTDIYAVGATIYKCITGNSPDESISRNIENDMKSPNQVDESIPRYISDAVMKAMAINSELRFSSIIQMKKVLQKKKTVKSEKRQIKNRKIRRTVILIAFIIFIILGGIGAYQYYRYKSSKIDLDNAVISVWIPVQVSEETKEEDLKAAEEQMLEISDKFLKEYNNVAIEVTAIPEDEYYTRLEEASNNGDLPTLFISDKASPEVLKNCLKWSDVYEYLDVSDCYFLKELKKEIEGGKQFPTAFTAPVIYVRRTNGIDMDSVEISDYSQLYSGASKGCYVDFDSYGMMINSFEGQFCYGDENVIDDTAMAMIDDFDTSNEIIIHDGAEEDEIYHIFEEGDITYYVASTKEYDNMKEKVPGLYSVRPISTDIIYGEFSRMWSIGDNSSEEEILAVKVLMNYMLAERPQKSMFISDRMLPLNKDVYASMIDIDINYDVLVNYPAKMRFQYGKQAYIDRIEADIYNNVIVGDETIEVWREE